MKTTSFAVCALLTSAALLFSASIVGAQTVQPDDEQIRSATARCEVTQCVVKAPVVNAPFSADATTTWHPPASMKQPSLRTTARYYRDSAGRVRVEQSFVGDAGQMKHFTSFFVTPDTASSTGEPPEESLGTAERWISPELEVVVYSRSEDAHFGVLEYQLTNIRRSEPPAELFEVPEDYKVTSFEYPLTWDGPYTPKARSK